MKRVLLASLSGLLMASLSACGGAGHVPDKQLDALRAEIVKLRTETAMLADRVGALERPSSKSAGRFDPASAPKDAASPESRDESSDRPPLEVVRLEPGARPSPEASPTASPTASDKQAQGGLALFGDAALHEDADEEDEPRPMLRSVAGGGVVEEKAKKAAAAVSPKGKPTIAGPRAAKAEVPR